MSRNCFSVTQWNWFTVMRCISGSTAVPPPTARIDSNANTHARLISFCTFLMPPVRSMRMKPLAQMREALGGLDRSARLVKQDRRRPQHQQHPEQRNLEDAHRHKGHHDDQQVERPDELLMPQL